MGTIIVTPSSVGYQQQEVTRTVDLAKESSNAVSKVPSTSAIGAGKGGIVLRDTILLGDYEKKFAEFTKSWPKLSAFSGAFGDASSFFRGSSLNPSISSGLARSSDNIDTSNSIGRQGYAVKEEIDEPPFDFRSNPIIASPLHIYPTPAASAFFRHLG
ncbi:hypothetical protein TSAR_003473 [Trichomalopsis sarcophagae]|uniref:Uncharacterized protein n=1 Tax=Trichomalopsis sarcophagae TaxID=543379 RepID=A0A232EQX2_9HYME|nr:hypothetical protein TSAR_003473 [Trichomalopsis sarcophagae]